jgi:hypothetical protein
MNDFRSRVRNLLSASLCLLLFAGNARAAKVDLLWVIDNSPSMDDEQAVLAAAADSLAEQMENASCPVDWRMAVAYTDLHQDPSDEDVCEGAPGVGRRALCPFTSDIDTFRDGTPECAYVRAGTCGGASERGFSAARIAIERFMSGTGCEPVPGTDCNLRPDASLAIIFMTDTGEQTPNRNAPPGQPDNTVASWVDYFSDYDLLTPGAQRADVHGILCPLRPTADNPEPCSDRLEDPALFDRYSDVIRGLGGAEGSIRNDDQSSLDATIRDIVAAAIAGACCGDGEVGTGEDCDDGNQDDSDCCTTSCRFAPSDTVCRPSAGTCDEPETCTGSSGICPADVFKPASTMCRAVAGDCDVAESCTGSSATCPTDAFKSTSTICRTVDGECDAAESCTGSSATCPPDAFKSTSTVCRPAANQCDAAEHCTGTGENCPSDTALPDTTPCEDGNPCTTGDTCWGFGCIAGPPVACTPLDTCHVAGVCDPETGTCSNPAAPDGTPCNDGTVCTQNDSCWGEHCMPGEPLPCDDGDACTEDSCEALWGCKFMPMSGMPGLSCLCAKGIMGTPSCSGESIPDGVSWRFKGACMLIARAETAPPKKQQKLIAKAGRKLRRASKLAAKPKFALSTGCSSALSTTLTGMQAQVQEIF